VKGSYNCDTLLNAPSRHHPPSLPPFAPVKMLAPHLRKTATLCQPNALRPSRPTAKSWGESRREGLLNLSAPSLKMPAPLRFHAVWRTQFMGTSVKIVSLPPPPPLLRRSGMQPAALSGCLGSAGVRRPGPFSRKRFPSVARALMAKTPGYCFADVLGSASATVIKPMNISSQLCNPHLTSLAGSGLFGFFAELS
jgi:hypothetical protein